MRIWRILLVVAAGFLITFVLWQESLRRDRDNLRNLAASDLDTTIHGLGESVRKLTLALDYLKHRWEFHAKTGQPITRKEWVDDVRQYIRDDQVWQAIEWVDAAYHVRWVEPVEGNERAVNLDLSFEPRRREALNASRTARAMTASETVDLVQGGKGVLIFVPLFPQDTFDGFILGVLRIQTMMELGLAAQVKKNYHVEVWDGNKAIYASSVNHAAQVAELVEEVTFSPRDLFSWRLRFTPKQDFMRTQRSRVSHAILLGGVVSSLFIGLLLLFIEDARLTHKKLTDTNTSLRYANETLRTTQIQLMQAEKMETIGQLSAGVAHEVKNPLATIAMGVDLLQLKLKGKNEAAVNVLSDIADAVERADSIIKGLLDYASPGSLDSSKEDVHVLIEGALTLTQHEFKKNRIEVVRNYAEHVPRLELDKRKITQVFVNLFTNATHAMEDGGGSLFITTGCRADGDLPSTGSGAGGENPAPVPSTLFVEIRDTGRGVDEKILHRLFDPFFTTRRTGAGAGLGLSVTRSILELHHATIRIENGREGGAIVTLEFPA